jgi:hypothetical protein
MEGAVPWGWFERGSARRSADARRGLSRNRVGRYVCGIVRHLHATEEGQKGKGRVRAVGGCIIWLLQAKNEEKVEELV